MKAALSSIVIGLALATLSVLGLSLVRDKGTTITEVASKMLKEITRG